MKIDKKTLEKNKIELTLEIEPSEYEKFLLRSAEKLSKNSKIDGFRPGKAPYDVVAKKFGELHILENALDEILTHFYFDTIIKEKIEAISQPKIDIKKLAPGNNIIFTATVNVLPGIELCDIEKIKIKKNKIEIDEKKITEAIETMREINAPEKEVESEAQKGDKVEIDFKTLVDGVAIEHGSEINYPLVIGKNQMIPGFENNLIGHKKGDEFSFKLNFPSPYHNKNLENKEAEFKIKMKKVSKIELPELNDEFAKKFKLKNLKELKEKLRENYKEEAIEKENRRLEMEAIEKIVENCKIGEFDDEIIKEEAEKMIRELQHDISSRGMNFEHYLNAIGKKQDELKQEFLPQAKKRLQASLVIRKIIDEQKFHVSDEELKEAINHEKMHYPENTEAHKQIESDSYKNYLINSLLNKKAIDYIKSKTILDK
ncbi:MAG TPA: trigger factor [bacterium]|jgi:trigger factor|nr:trigger factor [bacterium]HOG38569.1 trigger factor [bacterium]HQI03429.1 trigger factor [bacterium]